MVGAVPWVRQAGQPSGGPGSHQANHQVGQGAGQGTYRLKKSISYYIILYELQCRKKLKDPS